VYRTSDAQYVVLGGREMKFVTNLMTALGRPDLIAVAERPAGEQGELIDFLRTTFAGGTRAHWESWFAHKDVAFAPVLDFREALDQQHVAERGLWVEHDGSHMIGPAIRFADEHWTPQPAPDLNGDA
jgi:crotonobetainyl-CoA:carnitine CoA-transferase CaiB-like acyl-CoA transferase